MMGLHVLEINAGSPECRGSSTLHLLQWRFELATFVFPIKMRIHACASAMFAYQATVLAEYCAVVLLHTSSNTWDVNQPGACSGAGAGAGGGGGAGEDRWGYLCKFCMSMSMLHVHVCTACLCPCCMSMPVLHVYAYAACPCPCYTSMSMLHVHVHATRPCPCCMSMVYAACPFCMSMLHVHAVFYDTCLCCISMLLVHAACRCCMSLSVL